MTATELRPVSPERAALRSSKELPKPLRNPLGDASLSSTNGNERPSGVFSGTGHIVQTKERWNNPKINTYRLAAIFFAFIVFGMNDASYGALIPYVGSQIQLRFVVASVSLQLIINFTTD